MKRKSATKKIRARHELVKDLFLIFIGAVIAVLLAKSGVIAWLVNILGGHIIASFIAGIFFTSVFTIAPAAVALVSIVNVPIVTVAFWGALGAMIGDLIMFFFIGDRFAEDLLDSIKPSVTRHIINSFHFGFLKWLSPILGALIIASPLPDEFGLALLGLSKTKLSVLIPVAFAMNFVGIYLLLRFAQVI